MSRADINVVLFSGGRGSQVLSKELIANPEVLLTLAINGYDDGASTGRVRRLLGDCLGPSDFRKNASRLARALASCSEALIDLLDLRFPVGTSTEAADDAFRLLSGGAVAGRAPFEQRLAGLAASLEDDLRERVGSRLARFQAELGASDQSFAFSDCSIGNLIFAGSYLACDRRFNAAVDDYCALLGLPSGLIENVTDGTNAHLVALDRDNRLLASEAAIVDANRRNRIEDIFLIDRPPTEAEERRLQAASREAIARFLEERAIHPVPNPRLLERIARADLIIYAPGTQHSSLLPSYLTPGLGAAIAQNLTAIKLLITNLREDAEIPDASAVDLIAKAVYYMTEKSRRRIHSPCLITHTLVNDPTRSSSEVPYVPLGRIQSLEDPRLVRIGNYEEGTTGYHDARRVLTPFIESFLAQRRPREVAVLLLDTESLAKITQSILEALRGGLKEVAATLTFFYCSPDTLDDDFTRALPFAVCNRWKPGEAREDSLLRAVRDQPFDYTVLFESSGMYKGEDIANLVSLLQASRLAAVWGSRRLSIRDIHESYKLRYRRSPLLGAISYVGSHLLSLAYLALYGRYISDSLSGVRAIRTSYLGAASIDLKHKRLNQHLLSMLLRDRGEIFETPVQFFSMSPEKVKRTTVLDGLQSVATILWWRLKARRAGPHPKPRRRQTPRIVDRTAPTGAVSPESRPAPR